MGTDIHYVVEFQDDHQTWHGLYASDLFWSTWWQENFIKGLNTWHNDAYGLLDVRKRNYKLFAFLSAIHEPNPLAPYGFGDQDGWARKTNHAESQNISTSYAWPHDCSALALDILHNYDYHSKGWMFLADVHALVPSLTQLLPKLESNTTAAHSIIETLSFCIHIEEAMRTLFGTPHQAPLLNHPIGCIPPNGEKHLHTTYGISAHTFLTGTSYLHTHPTLDHHHPERIRILIGYDN